MPNLGLDNLTHRLRRMFSARGFDRAINATVQSVIGETREQNEPAEKPPCLVAGCPRDAISSHVIPDFLLRANGGKAALVTPVVSNGSLVSMESVDAGNEPRFPGYCHEHDVDLFPWETTGRFGGASATAGQLMRVTDATIHEVGVRARMLAALGSRLDPGSDRFDGVRARMSVEDERRLRTEAESLARSGAEAVPLLEDLHRLRGELESAAAAALGSAPTSPLPYLAYLHVPAGSGPHFADALWMPRGEVADIGSRAPLALCALTDVTGYHLMLATTGRDADALVRLEHLLRSADGAVCRFAAHCMGWATHYSFLDAATWEGLGDAGKTKLLGDLRLTYFTQAAFFISDPLRIPFIRAGNGWL